VSSIPSDHQLRAALRAARLIDPGGNAVDLVRSAYRATATKGEHTAADLEAGETLLLRAGLLLRVIDRLVPAPPLSVLVALGDPAALDLLARAVKQASGVEGALEKILVGERGEEFVVDRCRDELEALGRPDLSYGVRRVSLVSDSLGYDVVAPSIGSSARHLEVKTTTRQAVGSFEFYISRNEFEVGRLEPTSWSLVACRTEDEDVALVGWCRAAALVTYLPDDQNGFWTEARVRLPQSVLVDGIPPAL